MVVWSFTTSGWGEPGVRLVIRNTARAAVVLFMLAFGASGVHWVWATGLSRAMLRNRRALGVGFALAHGLHLAALYALHTQFFAVFTERDPHELMAGALTYGVIVLMAGTSVDRIISFLGARRWKLLHTICGYYIWIAFAQAYIPRAFADPFYIPFAVALVIVLGLRVAKRFLG